jgi:carboxymethylenebutenolidase
MRLSTLGIVSLLFVYFAAPVGAQEWAVEQLEESPRHHEWVQVQTESRTVYNFVAYPETSEPSLAVILIHENRGLTEWVRSMADQLAGAGYVTVAPDLLSGFDEDRDRTSDFEDSDAARSAIYELDPDQVIDDLQAVQRFAADLPSATGRTAVVGFCWGGSQTFRFATYDSELSAALVFYGSPPEDERIAMISTPVYGFYGQNDERINATIPDTESLMARHDKTYEYKIYEGVGHAFMRQGDAPDASETARRVKSDAFERMTDILSRLE